MEDLANSFDEDGGAILEVECGKNKAKLYVARLCQGSKGSCILFRESWLTPNEFQFVSGRQTAKDWKRSIRHKGKSLKLLLGKGVVELHPNVCVSEGCRKTLPKRKTRMGTRQRAPLAENVELKEANRDGMDESKGINNGEDDLKKDSGDVDNTQPDADYNSNSSSSDDSCDGKKDDQARINMQDTESSSHSEEAASENGDISPADGVDVSFENKGIFSSPQTSPARDHQTSDDSCQSDDHNLISVTPQNDTPYSDNDDDTTSQNNDDFKENETQSSEDDSDESDDSTQNASETKSDKIASTDDSSSTSRDVKDDDQEEKEPEMNAKPAFEDNTPQETVSAAVEEEEDIPNSNEGEPERKCDSDISFEVKHKICDIIDDLPSDTSHKDVLKIEELKKPNHIDAPEALTEEKGKCESEKSCSAPSYDAKPSILFPIESEEDATMGNRSPLPEETEDSWCARTKITNTLKYKTKDTEIMKNSVVDTPTAAGLSDTVPAVIPAATETKSAPAYSPSSSSHDAFFKVKGDSLQSHPVLGRDDRHAHAKVNSIPFHDDPRTSERKDTKRKPRLSTVIENLRTSKEKAMESSLPPTLTDRQDRRSVKMPVSNKTTERSWFSPEATKQAMNSASLYRHFSDRVSLPGPYQTPAAYFTSTGKSSSSTSFSDSLLPKSHSQETTSKRKSTQSTPVSMSLHQFHSSQKSKETRATTATSSNSKRHESKDKTPARITEYAALPPHFPCVDNRSMEGSYLDLVHRYNMALAHQHYREISSAYSPHLNLSPYPFPNGASYEHFMMDPLMLYSQLVHQQTASYIPNPHTSPTLAETSTQKRGVKRSSHHHSSSSSHSATRNSKTSSQSVNRHSTGSTSQSSAKQSEDALDLSVKKRKT